MPPPPPPSLPRSSSAPANHHHHYHQYPHYTQQSPDPPRVHATSFLSSRRRGSSAGSTAGFSSNLHSGHTTTTATTTTRHPSRRKVGLSDRHLVALANETAAMIQWDRILGGLRAPEPRLVPWRWLANDGPFALYTRHEAQRFAVLAVGVTTASVAELASLLQSHNPEQHVQRMEALFGDQVKHGAYVHDVDLARSADAALLPLASGTGGDAVLTQLSVKTATFHRANVLSTHEQWCFADAVFTDKANSVFEKHMTTLRPQDVYTGKSNSKTKAVHDVISGYFVHPEPATGKGEAAGDGSDASPPHVASSRVHFYAELFTPKSFGLRLPSSSAALSERALRHRLVRLAQACARLPQLVRRRRLGVQVLVDSTRLFPPTNVACVVCTKHLLVAKLCRLCGHGVCDDCSAKYERERAVRHSDRLRIESVRICALCMRRVNATDYAHVSDAHSDSDAAITSAHVSPDPLNAKPATAALTSLLQDALLTATTTEKKASVMNVIKCVLSQESRTIDPAFPPHQKRENVNVMLTETSTEKDYVRELAHLDVPIVPYTDACVAETTGRVYAVDPTAPLDQQLAFPIPPNEAQRLEAIQNTHIRELGRSEELSLICDMASREMDCFATLVTIVDQHELFVAASNLPSLELQTFARNDSFCSHMVMTGNPLIVPHPEADVRFHQCLPVKMLGTKYYCGFPVIAGDAVIGAMCCVDVKSRALTESQYTYLTKLADTAGKLVTLHAEQRERSLSTLQRDEPPSESPLA